MTPGIPNPNALGILNKMVIAAINIDTQEAVDPFTVLYNPESVVHSKSVKYYKSKGVATNVPVTQFAGGEPETIKFRLLFDTFSAGAEIGFSNLLDKAKFAGNMLLPSAGKLLDVRDYTNKVYKLMEVKPEEHRPPLVVLAWDALKVIGFLISCNVEFVKFNEFGMPVRAWMDCVFQQFITLDKLQGQGNESPDTTKYRTVSQGDSLWSLSKREYGEAGQWRNIAEANGLNNPRLLRSGELLSVPALR